MPIKVPVYEQKVGLEGLPGYRQNIRDSHSEALEGVGRGIADLGQAGAHIAGIARKAQSEQEEAQQMEVYETLQGSAEELLMDPAAGFAQKKGKDAISEHASVVSMFDAMAKAAEEKVPPSQRAKVRITAARLRKSFMASVNSHVVKEGDALHDQKVTGVIDTAKRSMVGAAQRGGFEESKESIIEARGAIHEAMQARAKKLGWDDEFTEAQATAEFTGAHINVIDAMIDSGRPDEAKAYLSFWQDDMNPEILEKSGVEKVLAAAMVKSDASTWAQLAMDKFPDDPVAANKFLTDKLEDKTISADTYQAGRREIKTRIDQDTKAQRAVDAPHLGAVRLDIEKNGQITSDSLVNFARMSKAAQADALRDERHRKNKSGKNGKALEKAQKKKDHLAILDFRAREFNKEPGQGQLEIDIDDAYPEVSSEARAEMRILQGKAGKAAQGEQGVSREAFRASIDMSIIALGLKGSPGKHGSQASLFAASMADSWARWSDEPKNTGKSPPSAAWERDALALAKGLTGNQAAEMINDLDFSRPASAPAARATSAVKKKDPPPPTEKPSKIRVRKPDGTTGLMPAGDATEAWLKAHKDWTRL